MTSESVGHTLRSVTASAFLPALVFEIGNGAIAPVIALTALDVGASPSIAALMLTFLGLGQVIGDVPSAWIADRVGDRRAMLIAAGAAIVGQLGCFFATSKFVLGPSLIVIGMCTATFYLARQAYLAEVVPAVHRARAMSTLGGAHRVGLFIGPFVGAGAIALGGLRAAFVVAMIASATTAVILVTVKDVHHAERRTLQRATVSVSTMLRSRGRLFATLGLAVLAVGAVRAARQTVLPLWAEHVGLGPEKTSLIFGIANAVDMALFYPSGKVMDHFGRLAVAVPSMLVLGASMMSLPLTHNELSLTLVALIISFGNGIGSGIMMTLGADASPVVGRTRFLSIWRLMSDSGNAAGPVVVSVVAAVTTLAVGIASVGAVGLLAAAGLARWAPRFSSFATPAMARRAREPQVPA
ncbi:MAG: MFS transporter [Actinobacteria bacterium]|nr:MFS transporter [Actinomycetota bacterium]